MLQALFHMVKQIPLATTPRNSMLITFIILKKRAALKERLILNESDLRKSPYALVKFIQINYNRFIMITA